MIFFIKKFFHSLYFGEEIIQYGLFLAIPIIIKNSFLSIVPIFIILGIIFPFLYKNYCYCEKYIHKNIHYEDKDENSFHKYSHIHTSSVFFYIISLLFVIIHSINYFMKILSIYNKNIFSLKMIFILSVLIFLTYLIIGNTKNIYYLSIIIKIIFFCGLFILLIINTSNTEYPIRILSNNFSLIETLPFYLYLFLGKENIPLFFSKISKDNYLEKKQFYFISSYGYIFVLLLYTAYLSLLSCSFFHQSSQHSFFFCYLLERYIKKIKYINILIAIFIFSMFLFIYRLTLKTTHAIGYFFEKNLLKKQISELIILIITLFSFIIMFKISFSEKTKMVCSIIALILSLLCYFYIGLSIIKEKNTFSLKIFFSKQFQLYISIGILILFLIICVMNILYF